MALRTLLVWFITVPVISFWWMANGGCRTEMEFLFLMLVYVCPCLNFEARHFATFTTECKSFVLWYFACLTIQLTGLFSQRSTVRAPVTCWALRPRSDFFTQAFNLSATGARSHVVTSHNKNGAEPCSSQLEHRLWRTSKQEIDSVGCCQPV